MAEDSPKRRKANFNEAETEVLIEQVLKHEQVLFAAGPGRASPGQKRKVWELIRHKVNPVAACPREVEDLKKRWRDLKRRDRSKLCRVTHGAGGVAPHPASFGLLMGNEDASPPDHLRSFPAGLPAPNEAVPIVGGIDTLDLPRASSVSDMGELQREDGPQPFPWPAGLRFPRLAALSPLIRGFSAAFGRGAGTTKRSSRPSLWVVAQRAVSVLVNARKKSCWMPFG